MLPYSINATPWADHAVAERLVAIPGTSSIKAEGEAWSFPKDSVLVKTLSLDLEKGNPSSRRRIETQILHFDGLDWQPYTYQWNDDQTDAVLLGPAGAERTFEVVDPDAIGGKRRQTWRFSGRAECQRCHNKWSGPPLGFNAPQLNKPHDYGGTSGLAARHVRTHPADRQADPPRRTGLASPGRATPRPRSTSGHAPICMRTVPTATACMPGARSSRR